MLDKALGFITTFKYWLLALAVLLPTMYMKGCADGRKQVESDYNKVSAEIQSAARRASETAAAKKETRDAVIIKQNEELRNEIETKSGDTVGANTRRVLDRLRGQQSGSDKTTK